MTQENTPPREESGRSAWIGPFVARDEDAAAARPAPEAEALPPLHLSREGRVAPETISRESVPPVAEAEAVEEAEQPGGLLDASPAGGWMASNESGTGQDFTAVDSGVQQDAEQVPADAGSEDTVSGSSWDDEPWASTPVSEASDTDLSAGIMEGEFLLDLPSVALPAEGIESREPPPPPPAPAVSEGEARGAPDWQQWLHDNRAAGGHHFPSLEDPDNPPPREVKEDEAPVDMGGDLSGLDHYDWIDFPEDEELPAADTAIQGEGSQDAAAGEKEAEDAGSDHGGSTSGSDFGWLQPPVETGAEAEEALGDDFDLDVGPDPEVESGGSFIPAAAGHSGLNEDSADEEVEAIAARLERIARSLREHGLTGPLAERDPLGTLIAGYLLGATSRGDEEGSR